MILLLGGSGFIGTDIASTLKKHHIAFISPLHHELNLNEKTNIFQFFEKNKIETVIWSVSTYNPLNISNTVVDHILFRNILDGVLLAFAGTFSSLKKLTDFGVISHLLISCVILR